MSQISERRQANARREEKALLKRQIAFMTRGPGNFRDLLPGSEDWYTMMQIYPDLKKQMKEWHQGPILYLGVLAPSERLQLENGKHEREFIAYEIVLADVPTFDEMQQLHETAEVKGVSFVYPKGLNQFIVQGMKNFFRAYNGNSRIKIPLMMSNGKPYSPQNDLHPSFATIADVFSYISMRPDYVCRTQAEQLLFYAKTDRGSAVDCRALLKIVQEGVQYDDSPVMVDIKKLLSREMDRLRTLTKGKDSPYASIK